MTSFEFPQTSRPPRSIELLIHDLAGIAPDLYPASAPLPIPQSNRAGAAEEVLPELGVGEGLLVGAEELEDGAGGDEDHLPLGPAQGNSQPPRVEQKLAGGEEIFAVALGSPDEDDGALATLEALDGVDRGERHGSGDWIDQGEGGNPLLQIGALRPVRDDDAESALGVEAVAGGIGQGKELEDGSDELLLEAVADLALGFVVDDD